jgi:hypothetical protein
MKKFVQVEVGDGITGTAESFRDMQLYNAVSVPSLRMRLPKS